MTDLNGEPNKTFTNALKVLRIRGYSAGAARAWRIVHTFVVDSVRSMDDEDLAYYSIFLGREAVSHLKRDEPTQRSLEEGRSTSLPVPATPQTSVPEPPPAPEPVASTAGYPIPTNTRAPEVQMRDGMRCFSYSALYQATNGFSADRVLGSGGYGNVHAGVPRNSLLGTGGWDSTTQVASKCLIPQACRERTNFERK